MSAYTRRETRKILRGLLFVSPWLIGFLAFTLYPLIASAFYSLTDYDVLRPPKFVGLANYVQIFVKDDLSGSRYSIRFTSS